jgi:hypothetical protein
MVTGQVARMRLLLKTICTYSVVRWHVLCGALAEGPNQTHGELSQGRFQPPEHKKRLKVQGFHREGTVHMNDQFAVVGETSRSASIGGESWPWRGGR